MKKFGIIILAAGSSSRLGSPKQLLKYNDKSLLQHIVTEANLAVENEEVIVVTGANQDLLETELSQLPVHVIHNDNWEQGMASSINCGLESLLKIYPDLNGIIFSVCDQPFVSVAVFKSLVEKHDLTGKGIIASFYNDTLGVPMYFDEKYFDELAQLQGHSGAKQMVNKYPKDIGYIEFPDGVIDIDTDSDYQNLVHFFKPSAT